MAPNGPGTAQPEHKCCGVVEEAREKRAARRAKAQPWIIRKFAIFMTVALTSYAFYVYIGRLCVPMIRRDPGALGGRGMGIGFLVVFSIFGLIVIWAYEKIVFTSPGYAKDYVQKSPAPVIKKAFPTWWDTESEAELAAARYQSTHPPATQKEHKEQERHHTQSSMRSHAETRDQNVGITDAIPPVAAVRAKATADKGPASRPEQAEQKPMMFTRKPPTTPILLPEYRYCHKDGFQKPLRAHHCRACGTCVLKYDHHCPWIGQCVGARNHRFFVIFVFWALWFWAWTFATLVGVNARAASVRSDLFDIDGQQVAIMVLSGLFVLFTVALLWTHVDMICQGQSTVESLGVRRMHEREQRVLKRLHSWWDFRGKRQTRKQWDAEWGRVGKEGHPWWLGSARANWEATMGAHAWMWFLPIGKSPDDGLSYELNPRFDAEGRWRPRKEWPEELR
ncbi:zf-DHHC-domain-containing protein [Cubamyces menziesii]|nr:zf-DHHC-domain-containing protein [Cubamyces menziesii]